MNELNNNNKIPKTVDPEVAKKDLNGDGHITQKELEMDLEFKRKELEDADARRDAMRTMTWFALLGMLFYPSGILITAMLGQDTACKINRRYCTNIFCCNLSISRRIFRCKCICR